MTWQTVKLGEVLKHRKGSITIEDNKEYKLCRVQLHRRGVVLREYRKGIEIGTKKQQVCKANDFIVAEMDAKVGGYGFVPEDLQDAIVSSHYYLFELNEEKIKRDFLEVICQTTILQEQIKATGSTNYAAIRPIDVLSWEINLPPLDRQIEISKNILSIKREVSKISTELNHQLALVKELRQAYLREAMQGKLVPQDSTDEAAEILLEKIKAEKEKLAAEKRIRRDKPLPPINAEEIPFEIPSNWIWCRFADIALIESNLVSPFDYPNLPHVAPDNIEKNTGKLLPYKTVLEDEVKSANHYFYPKQLIYSKVRPKLNKVVLVDFEGLCSADMYPIKPLIDSRFLQSGMLSEYFLVEVDKFDNRVKMPKINQNQLSQIPTPLPPLAEQERIVAKLEKLMKFCDALEVSLKQGIKNADQLLQTALKEALQN